jgi:hypothetical protein
MRAPEATEGFVWRPRLSPEITFGHLLQAAVLLVTLGGGALTSYLSLRTDISQVRAEVMSKVEEHEYRMSSIEQVVKELRGDNHEFQADMRAAMARMMDLLTDVRLQVAHRGVIK